MKHAVVIVGGGPTGMKELAVPAYRGCEVTAFTQDATGVDVTRSDGRSLRADYVVGCDGGRSRIRKQVGNALTTWFGAPA